MSFMKSGHAHAAACETDMRLPRFAFDLISKAA